MALQGLSAALVDGLACRRLFGRSMALGLPMARSVALGSCRRLCGAFDGSWRVDGSWHAMAVAMVAVGPKDDVLRSIDVTDDLSNIMSYD